MSGQVKGVGSGGRKEWEAKAGAGLVEKIDWVGKNNMGRAGTHIQRDMTGEWRTSGLRKG